MPVEFDERYFLLDAGDKAIAQRRDIRGVFIQFCDGEAQRLRHADDAGHVGRAAAHAALLMPARQYLARFHARTDIQRADALGAVKFVPRNAHHVDARRVHVERDRPRRLHRVGKKQDFMFLRDLGDLCERLQRTDLVVCRHHADKNRFGAYTFFQFRYVHRTEFVHGSERHLESFLFQFSGGGKHGGVLDGADDQMIPARAVCVRRPADRPVVSLGTARSEIYFVGFRADERSDGVPRLVHASDRLAAEGMLGIRVAEYVRKIRRHFRKDRGVQSRRRRVI